MSEFMVHAVCKPSGEPVAYVQWGGPGQYKAHRLAEALTRRERGQAGKFFVKPLKVRRETPVASIEGV